MKDTMYDRVAGKILNLICNGVLKEGEKLPSMRQLSAELGVSINTVKEAYWKLEKQNYIESVPQSGFYVKKQYDNVSLCASIDPILIDPKKLNLCQVHGALQSGGKVSPGINLGISNVDPELLPADKLGKYMQEAVRYHDNESLNYILSPGYPELLKQVARLGISCGMNLSPDEIIITNGCHEAIFLSMMAVCKPGDTVIFESPIYFSSLQLLQHLDLKIIEVPSSQDEGINLDTLKFILENHNVRAMFSIPNFNNPLGFTMPDKKKEELVRILAQYNVTLIEDDVYGELYHEKRSSACKAFDREGNVIHCSSLTKTVAPGLRIGWIIPGKYYGEVNRLKTILNIATASITQIASARFLKEGGYDRHMRRLRETVKNQVHEMRECIIKSFPRGTEVTAPEGGTLLWVTLPDEADSYAIYQEALKSNILIAPGCLFTVKDKYCNCLRINAGYWNDDIRSAVLYLAGLCRTNIDSRKDNPSKAFI